MSSVLQSDSCEKHSFEISKELCKDAMVEKIILISLAYLCTATEMRILVHKNKSSQNLTIKDSEMYHAKALHICSIFLPKDTPIVQNITKSYKANYLKDKREFDVDSFLHELGVLSSTVSEIRDEISSSLIDQDIDEG